MSRCSFEIFFGRCGIDASQRTMAVDNIPYDAAPSVPVSFKSSLLSGSNSFKARARR